ncbi:MAG: transglycosylase domain-containing protein [Treponema sp.]|nr:transglycosylase domain-containing protein [Treponema sp.]
MKKMTKFMRIFLFILTLFSLAAYLTLRFLPYPELTAFQEREYSLVLTDKNGAVLRAFPVQDGVKREWTDVEDVPQGVRNVFITAEDKRFYSHIGVDPVAVMARAIRNMSAKQVVSGASTITMQLARLIKPRTRDLGGKIAEALDALRLEARLSKNAILELWLNNIPFGSNIEGLGAFSRARFGMAAPELDDVRAAALAVVPRRPALYDPAYNAEASLIAARQLAARCNVDAAGLAAAVAEAAASANAPAQYAKTPFYAPHFTERVRALLSNESGYPDHASAEDASGSQSRRQGTGRNTRQSLVQTTLDLDLQLYAEDRLRTELAKLSLNRVNNGAVLVIENETGAVLCYTGSASWFDDEVSGKIDGVQVRNQPGSCLKPFLYALALESGFGPNAVLPDIPSVFGADEAYVPMNFNRRFNGPVRMRVALASSLNVAAVWTLEQIGVNRFEDSLVSLGFTSITEKRGSYGTGLALGNADVSLEELVKAFSVFQRDGILIDVHLVGEPGKSARVLSPYTAFVIRDILSDKASRWTGFGTAPVFATPFQAMFKTGTANQYQNIWALGATERWTAGVWMGNFSGATVVGKTGSSIPARIAADILTALETAHPAYPSDIADTQASGGTPPGRKSADAAVIPRAREDWAMAGEVTDVEICALSGMSAAPFCTGTLHERLLRDRVPGFCDWHHAGGVIYPAEYRSWLAERFRTGQARRGNGSIRLPRQGAVFYADPSLPADAQAIRMETAGFGDDAFVFIDGVPAGSLDGAGVFMLPVSRGKRTVLVEDDESCAQVEFEVR